MSSGSFGSVQDLASYLKPHSEKKAEFFKHVIMYANRFMIAHQTLFDLWQSRHTPTEEDSLYCSNDDDFRMPNKLLAEKLAILAKDEISKYFRTLKELKSLDRGEVVDWCLRTTHCSDGRAFETSKIFYSTTWTS